MRRWVTEILQPARVDAMSKAKNDVADLAETLAYQKLPVFVYDDSGESDAGLAARIDGIITPVRQDDIVVYQYPSKWFGYRFDSTFIKRLVGRGSNVIIFVHDIYSYTGDYEGVATVADEVELFNLSKAVITHGEKMGEWLTENDVTTALVNSKKLFDYQVNALDAPLDADIERRITVAGYLPKSPFLCDWSQNIPIDAFGRKEDMVFGENVIWHGEFSNEALVREIPKNTFGLCWSDNTSTLDKSRMIRHHDFQRMNNPLKVSNYLSLGLPVIVWDEAATAAIIEKYNIGFTIADLSEIENRLSNLTDEELHVMKANANNFSRLTRNGYFTRTSILEAENIILGNNLN